jgi:hypothetical protein
MSSKFAAFKIKAHSYNKINNQLKFRSRKKFSNGMMTKHLQITKKNHYNE